MWQNRGVTTTNDFHGLPIADLMRSHNVPGVSIAVIADHQLVETAQFGVQASDGTRAVTEATTFQACSISKMVTAVGVHALVDRGLVELDMDVSDVLTRWRIPHSAYWTPRISVRNLLSHTAGLSISSFPGYTRGADLPELLDILDGRHPANTAAVKSQILPGTQFLYSGGGITVLQLLMEELTGEQFSDLMKQMVLRPLGMRDSTFEQPTHHAAGGSASSGHDIAGRPISGGWRIYPEQAAAGLWTTPSDLATFLLAIQHARAGNVTSALSEASVSSLLAPQVATPGPQLGGLGHMGLGAFLAIREGGIHYFGHGGWNEGYRAHVLAHADAGVGVAIMVNGEGGNPLLMRLIDHIAKVHNWPFFTSSAPPERHDESHGVDTALDAFAGTYALSGGHRLRLEQVGGCFTAYLDGQPPHPLVPVGIDRIVSWATDTTFTRADDSGITLHQAGISQFCRRIPQL